MSTILKTAFTVQRFAALRHYSSLSTDKIYELRTYCIWPQHVKEFLKLTDEEFHLRTAYSKLCGYWTSELGGINQVVHIWEYDSLEHRAKVRATLASNNDWIQRYFSKILPFMSCQENSTMKVLPLLKLSDPKEKGVYQLQTLQLRGSAKKWEPLLKQVCDDVSPSGLLVGAFRTVHGPANEAVLLWQHPTLTDSVSLQESLQSSTDERLGATVHSTYSKILIPHKVSPFQ